MRMLPVLLLCLMIDIPSTSWSQEGPLRFSFANGFVASGIVLRGVEKNAVVYFLGDSLCVASLDSLTEIRQLYGSSWWDGASTGATIGAGVGLGAAVLANVRSKDDLSRVSGAVLFLVAPATLALAGGLIGGIVTTVSSEDDVIDVAGDSVERKHDILQGLIDHQSPATQ